MTQTREQRNEYVRKWRQSPVGRAYTRRWNERRKKQRRDDPDLVRREKFRSRYGLELEDYERMLDDQGNACAVCRRDAGAVQRLHVDHAHETGEIRGLLCGPCNRALGMLGEDPSRMVALARYIRRSA